MRTSKQFYTELTAEGLSKRKKASYTKKELNYLKKILNKKDKILDLACGYGRFTIPLAKQGYNIEGIDITPSLIKKAKQDAKKEKVKVIFKVGDIRKLPYKNEIFNKIICMWSAFLELSKKSDQIKALKEIIRILKKDGFVFLEMSPPIKKIRGKIIDKKTGVELIIKKDITIGKISDIESPAMYRHNKKTFMDLFKKIKIKRYKISVSNFGGRKRLLVRFWK